MCGILSSGDDAQFAIAEMQGKPRFLRRRQCIGQRVPISACYPDIAARKHIVGIERGHDASHGGQSFMATRYPCGEQCWRQSLRCQPPTRMDQPRGEQRGGEPRGVFLQRRARNGDAPGQSAPQTL